MIFKPGFHDPFSRALLLIHSMQRPGTFQAPQRVQSAFGAPTSITSARPFQSAPAKPSFSTVVTAKFTSKVSPSLAAPAPPISNTKPAAAYALPSKPPAPLFSSKPVAVFSSKPPANFSTSKPVSQPPPTPPSRPSIATSPSSTNDDDIMAMALDAFEQEQENRVVPTPAAAAMPMPNPLIESRPKFSAPAASPFLAKVSAVSVPSVPPVVVKPPAALFSSKPTPVFSTNRPAVVQKTTDRAPLHDRAEITLTQMFKESTGPPTTKSAAASSVVSSVTSNASSASVPFRAPPVSKPPQASRASTDVKEPIDIDDRSFVFCAAADSPNCDKESVPKCNIQSKLVFNTTDSAAGALQLLNPEARPEFRNPEPEEIRQLVEHFNHRPDAVSDTYPRLDPSKVATWIYPSNVAHRDYQYHIARKALTHNTLVALPTGLGKTMVAAVVMYNFWRWFPEGRLVFVAPTRPLVAQQEQAVHRATDIPQSDMCVLTGTVTNAAKRRELYGTKRIIFATPQIIEADFLSGALDPMNVCCLVVDEAHKSTGNFAFVGVVKALSGPGCRCRILALSATPGNSLEQVQQVVRNLRIERIDARSDDDPDVRKYVHGRTTDIIELPVSSAITALRRAYNQLINVCTTKLRNMGVGLPVDAEHINRYSIIHFTEQISNNTIQVRGNPYFARIELGLVQTLLCGRQYLGNYGMQNLQNYLREKFASSTQRNYCELRGSAEYTTVMQLLDEHRSQGLAHPKLIKLQEVVVNHFRSIVLPPPTSQGTPMSQSRASRVIIFCENRSGVDEIVAALKPHAPLVKAMPFVGQKKQGGKGLSQKEQQAIIEAFKRGGYNTLVATSIGEEGLDIGEVDLIVSYDHTNSSRTVQRMGRTGRARSGRCVVLASEGAEANSFRSTLDESKRVFQFLRNTKPGSRVEFCKPDSNPVGRLLPAGIIPQCTFVNFRTVQYEKPNSKVDADVGLHSGSAYLSTEEEIELQRKYELSGPLPTIDLNRHLNLNVLQQTVHRISHSDDTHRFSRIMRLCDDLQDPAYVQAFEEPLANSSFVLSQSQSQPHQPRKRNAINVIDSEPAIAARQEVEFEPNEDWNHNFMDTDFDVPYIQDEIETVPSAHIPPTSAFAAESFHAASDVDNDSFELWLKSQVDICRMEVETVPAPSAKQIRKAFKQMLKSFESKQVSISIQSQPQLLMHAASRQDVEISDEWPAIPSFSFNARPSGSFKDFVKSQFQSVNLSASNTSSAPNTERRNVDLVANEGIIDDDLVEYPSKSVVLVAPSVALPVSPPKPESVHQVTIEVEDQAPEVPVVPQSLEQSWILLNQSITISDDEGDDVFSLKSKKSVSFQAPPAGVPKHQNTIQTKPSECIKCSKCSRSFANSAVRAVHEARCTGVGLPKSTLPATASVAAATVPPANVKFSAPKRCVLVSDSETSSPLARVAEPIASRHRVIASSESENSFENQLKRKPEVARQPSAFQQPKKHKAAHKTVVSKFFEDEAEEVSSDEEDSDVGINADRRRRHHDDDSEESEEAENQYDLHDSFVNDIETSTDRDVSFPRPSFQSDSPSAEDYAEALIDRQRTRRYEQDLLDEEEDLDSSDLAFMVMDDEASQPTERRPAPARAPEEPRFNSKPVAPMSFASLAATGLKSSVNRPVFSFKPK